MLGSPPQRPSAFAVPTTREFIFEIAGVPFLAFFCASMSWVFAQVSLEFGLSQRESSGTSLNLRKRASLSGLNTLESRHSSALSRCPLPANSRHSTSLNQSARRHGRI
jgi:hypothetical protein